MPPLYRLGIVQFVNGERLPMLIDQRDGRPAYLPTL